MALAFICNPHSRKEAYCNMYVGYALTEVNALLLLVRLMPVNVPVGPDDSASLSDLAIAYYTE